MHAVTVIDDALVEALCRLRPEERTAGHVARRLYGERVDGRAVRRRLEQLSDAGFVAKQRRYGQGKPLLWEPADSILAEFMDREVQRRNRRRLDAIRSRQNAERLRARAIVDRAVDLWESIDLAASGAGPLQLTSPADADRPVPVTFNEALRICASFRAQRAMLTVSAEGSGLICSPMTVCGTLTDVYEERLTGFESSSPDQEIWLVVGDSGFVTLSRANSRGATWLERHNELKVRQGAMVVEALLGDSAS